MQRRELSATNTYGERPASKKLLKWNRPERGAGKGREAEYCKSRKTWKRQRQPSGKGEEKQRAGNSGGMKRNGHYEGTINHSDTIGKETEGHSATTEFLPYQTAKGRGGEAGNNGNFSIQKSRIGKKGWEKVGGAGIVRAGRRDPHDLNSPGR